MSGGRKLDSCESSIFIVYWNQCWLSGVLGEFGGFFTMDVKGTLDERHCRAFNFGVFQDYFFVALVRLYVQKITVAQLGYY